MWSLLWPHCVRRPSKEMQVLGEGSTGVWQLSSSNSSLFPTYWENQDRGGVQSTQEPQEVEHQKSKAGVLALQARPGSPHSPKAVHIPPLEPGARGPLARRVLPSCQFLSAKKHTHLQTLPLPQASADKDTEVLGQPRPPIGEP